MSWIDTIRLSCSSTEDEKGHRTYNAVYRVLFDNGNDGPGQCYTAAGIPSRKSLYVFGNDSHDYAKCKNRAVDFVTAGENIAVYDVTCVFDTNTEEYENPLDEPAKIEWDGAKFSTVCDKDRNGDAILNTAGDPFDPPTEKDDSRPILRVTRNEAAYIDSIADEYRDTINDATWNGYPAGTVKVSKISASSEQAALVDGVEIPYWVVTYEFEFNRDTWKKKIVNMGYRKIDIDGDLVHILDKNLNPVAKPVLLNEDGDDVTDTPFIVEKDVYDESDFSTFGITL